MVGSRLLRRLSLELPKSEAPGLKSGALKQGSELVGKMQEFENFANVLGPIGLFCLGALWLLLKFKVIGPERNGTKTTTTNQDETLRITKDALEKEIIARHDMVNTMNSMLELSKTNLESLQEVEKRLEKQGVKIHDLHQWISKEDEFGVKLIHGSRPLEKVISDLSQSVQAQTKVFEGFLKFLADINQKVDALGG